MNGLSLFDGMSCGQIALQKRGIKYNKYFASEIKPYAITVTQHNFPKTIQLGDITKLQAKNLPKIDLLIGGSPCQNFSIASSSRTGLQGEKSSLFFEFLRLKNALKPKYWLFENVRMKESDYKAVCKYLKAIPVRINSSLVSAQLRDRFYWTNIGPGHFDKKGYWNSTIPQREMERLQTIPEGYTKIVSKNHAASLLGDGWTVDVIVHILSQGKF
jgi:DNA (cytosine-5)-methyltransferase 3A